MLSLIKLHYLCSALIKQCRDKRLEERSYLKPVKGKLTSCTTTGHVLIVFKLVTPALAPSGRDSMHTQRTQQCYS